MDYLVNNLLEMVGAGLTDLYSFSELITWFITVLIAVELVLFVLDGIFYTVRNVVKGIK